VFPPPRISVGHYLRRNQAEERALVVLALGLPYWIAEEEGLYHLFVEETHAPRVAAELASYEAERRDLHRERHKRLPTPPLPKGGVISLVVYGWVLAIFFMIQQAADPGWSRLGSARSSSILAGEWWRTVTALTLHGSLEHLLANLVVGAIFAAALLPWLGVGGTWLGFLASGALGNAINAWVYGGSGHDSIGASTAVFGALGLLVGWQVSALLRRRQTRLRVLFVPVAAGVALFAFLGIGEEHSNIDVMGHLWGMVAGGGLGLAFGWGHGREVAPTPAFGRTLGWLALTLPWLCWGIALAVQ